MRSRGNQRDTSATEGTVTVRVLLNVRRPTREVVFCNRMQEVSR